MIESQRGEAACFSSFCSNSNKQTTEDVSEERTTCLEKTNANVVCLWLTDEMFNISIRSWFPLWLPPGTSDVLKWQLFYYLLYPLFIILPVTSLFLWMLMVIWLSVSFFDIYGCGVWTCRIWHARGPCVYFHLCGGFAASDCELGFK